MHLNKTKTIILNHLFFTVVLIISPPILADNQAGLSTPKVPFKYAVGKKKYQENCALCHGKWMGGTKNGPPLLHAFYKPTHHDDPAFYRAALKGVRAHHWKFGDMPKVQGITVRDMNRIVPFIRWLQRENGLYQ